MREEVRHRKGESRGDKDLIIASARKSSDEKISPLSKQIKHFLIHNISFIPSLFLVYLLFPQSEATGL